MTRRRIQCELCGARVRVRRDGTVGAHPEPASGQPCPMPKPHRDITETFSICMTREERRLLMIAARRAGVSVSRLVRDALAAGGHLGQEGER